MSYRDWQPFTAYYRPLTYFRGIPVYLTTLLVVTHVVAMLATAGILGFGSGTDVLKWQHWICFSSNFWESGRVWTLLSYPFYHNIISDHIFFAIEMVFFYWFGHEVERFIGRPRFAILYGLLAVVPPLVLTSLKGFLGPVSLSGGTLLHFGMFIAFVGIQPNAQFLAGVTAKWLAYILLFICTVFIIAVRSWQHLAQLWMVTLLAACYVRNLGSGVVDWLDKARLGHAEKKMRARVTAYQQQVKQDQENVDAILEKISRSGLTSLSSEERAVLERTSKKLAQEEKRH